MHKGVTVNSNSNSVASFNNINTNEIVQTIKGHFSALIYYYIRQYMQAVITLLSSMVNTKCVRGIRMTKVGHVFGR